MNPSNFEQILDNCLARLQSGENIDQCLADHPENASELRPLLLAAAAVHTRSFPTARPRAVNQGQSQMLAALADKKAKPAVSFGPLRRYAERILSFLKQEEASKMRTALRSVVTTLILIFVAGIFSLSISANSLPGDPFYPLKRGWESLRFGLTFDAEARQQWDEQVQQNRREELAALIELGRQTQIVYDGFVEEIEEDQLIVDGFIFETNNDTRWQIEPEIDEAVRIETRISANGDLTALRISASDLTVRPEIIVSPTPCNDPTCSPPTETPCTPGACDATPTASVTPPPSSPTPTPCNTPACGTGSPTPSPTPCEVGCGSPTPVPSGTPVSPTPTPCNDPVCSPPSATPTPCNAGACGGPTVTSTPFPTSTAVNPTPTPCNTPACAPPTSTPCPPGACGNPTSTPVPSNTPPNPSATPCNSPACAPPTPTPTPCNAGACGPASTATPNSSPTATPCNSPVCGSTATPIPSATSSAPTPTPCNAGACGNPTPTPCNSPSCSSNPFLPPY